MMNSSRYLNIGKPSGSHLASVWLGALIPILVCFCLVFHSLFFTIPHAGDGRHGQSSLPMVDPGGLRAQKLHSLPAALFGRLTTTVAPMAIVVQGLFSMPADTETAGTESAMAKLAKPFHFILACNAGTTRRTIAVRRMPIPLYLYYQSLLC